VSRWTLIKSYWLWELLFSIIAIYYRKTFPKLKSKLLLYTSSFGALIISNLQVPQKYKVARIPQLHTFLWFIPYFVARKTPKEMWSSSVEYCAFSVVLGFYQKTPVNHNKLNHSTLMVNHALILNHYVLHHIAPVQ